ncbi:MULTISPECIES: IS982 family transposase [spotted fever group]|uniref:IS982 family transposase n=1 Tax=spotted fever group TaxID=114277 RepID=UPI0009FE715C|nr:IS982 family transposase [Rickettsia endosymbiont of Ixodes scapularis]
MHHQRDFQLVSYSQFIKIIGPHLPLLVLIFNSILDQCDGLSFVDSSNIEVCKRYRISMNKVFAGIAASSKTTKGWFYGLKLHLIINRAGGIVKASFSPGNKDDRKQLELIIKNLFGKVFGDRGYISQQLFLQLLEQGIFMVTRVKKNMKNKLMSMLDKILLLKKALIESVFSKIKLLGKFEHSRHRSVTNAFVHMVAALINYQMSDNKPSITSLLIC